MRLEQFEITNFKGIEKTTLSLSSSDGGYVTTLIGLNESGKTTILEALSYFVTEDKDIASLVETVHAKTTLQDVIPKDRKAAFTDDISIEAVLKLTDEDEEEFAGWLAKNHSIELERGSLLRSFTVDRKYTFKDTKLQNTDTYWSFKFKGRKRRSKKFHLYAGSRDNSDMREVWLNAISVYRDKIPKIVYFPTFLFQFPNRIYLEKSDDETNSYYKQVIQDVLDSQGDGLNIDTHIVERINRLRAEHPTLATFVAYLFGQDEKKQIDAVLQKTANKMSEVIFGSWNEVLGRSASGKRVSIDWFLDSERENAAYLEISIVDGPSTYSLSERSLGFRWFFAFLLFTQFRQNRKANAGTIFLFDEPASNLHSRAQMKLLDSFSRISNENTKIIYSTHSHYMVNTNWLEQAYIIDNKANDYDNEDDIGSFSLRKTEIEAIPYKRFVGENPTKTTYYQPVLDALNVAFSPLVRSDKALIVEGKNDFYPLSYFRRTMERLSDRDVFPSNGAGSASALISLFLGWGVNFKILLDGDGGGKDGRRKYTSEFLLDASDVLTLGDIDQAFDGKAIESLFADDVRTAAKEHFGVSKLTKRHFSVFFQMLAASGEKRDFAQTEENFEKLFESLEGIDRV